MLLNTPETHQKAPIAGYCTTNQSSEALDKLCRK